MNLRARHRTGLTSLGYDIAALDRVAALYKQILVVGIGGYPAAFMADENQVAIALQLIAGIGDDASFCRTNVCPLRDRDIDALVAQAAWLRPIARYNPTLNRPAEAEAAGFLRRLLAECMKRRTAQEA